ncbi:MAG: hypothetical protein ACK6DS_20060, partial [Planctomycetota bacterium]
MSQPASPLVNHLPSAGLVRDSSRRDPHAVRYRSCWPLVRLLTARLLTACFLTALLPLQAVDAQSSIAPRFTSSNDVPGTVAFASLLANPQWVGRVQPVKLQLPENTVVGTWQGSWVDTEYANPTVATSVGPIYQVRIRGEFRTQSFDLYPSLEIVSCLNPPADLQLRFPVPIAISEEDIET